MKGVQTIQKNNDFRTFLLICLFAGAPVYWAALFYIEVVTREEIEELALAATIAFFLFFYVGWSMPPLWLHYGRQVLRYLRVMLALIILAGIIWMFVHADIQLHTKPAINLLLFWGPFVLLASAIGAFVNLVRKTVQQQLWQANISAEQSRSELHMLQSQLSPHFLFNTLNNLYGLSITQHQKIPPLLLKLSDLLRYSVYDAKELFVPLKEELAYINNYIDFERLRIGDRLHLTIVVEAVPDNAISIAPMLLIVFIENAFKHAKNTAEENISIQMELKFWADQILFSLRNSYNSSARQKELDDRAGGLGLENVQRRLALLYPGEHHLKITDEGAAFAVQLQLKMK
jgi:hypothetical protein